MSITSTEHSLQQRHDEAAGQLTTSSGGNFSTLRRIDADEPRRRRVLPVLFEKLTLLIPPSDSTS